MSNIEKQANWSVSFSPRANRQTKRLTEKVRLQLFLLVKELEILGPIRRNWAHFSALKKGKDIPVDAYHCHIKSGRPTYVVYWRIENKHVKIIEIYYVGTHENAPY
jgi:mRNA-degrading endonuclease RelE of RelBE toxin-antitoxin system